METIEDARSFFRELTDKHRLNFHPDTPFEEFDVLTKAQVKTLNRKMEEFRLSTSLRVGSADNTVFLPASDCRIKMLAEKIFVSYNVWRYHIGR
jgi:hypothetical protein